MSLWVFVRERLDAVCSVLHHYCWVSSEIFKKENSTQSVYLSAQSGQHFTDVPRSSTHYSVSALSRLKRRTIDKFSFERKIEKRKDNLFLKFIFLFCFAENLTIQITRSTVTIGVAAQKLFFESIKSFLVIVWKFADTRVFKNKILRFTYFFFVFAVWKYSTVLRKTVWIGKKIENISKILSIIIAA